MKFKMGPKIRWNLSRILPFGLIWLVTGLVFLFSDKLAVGEGPVPEGAINPDGKVVFFASLAVFDVGLMIGMLEVLVVNRWFLRFSFIKTVVYKFMLYTLLFAAFISFAYPIAASLELQVPLTDSGVWDKFSAFWGSNAFWSTALQLTFSLFLCLIYGAISENLGHSVLLNFFLGRYHRPKREERIFLFLDMNDSTAVAERLGDVRYFKFLQAYYDALSDPIIKNGGEVYQYIGDEIVITWPKQKGIKQNHCIHCFFDMKEALWAKGGFFEKEFGHRPKFKAGMHLGKVTTGEIGALKKEIVFTGDVLNTAARIQGLCKDHQSELLISKDVVLALGSGLHEHTLQEIGKLDLKGKLEKVVVYGVY